jgi:Fe-S oxidoreductase
MCGACDVSCKYGMDMEVLEPINEFRIRCVESGRTSPRLDAMIRCLQREGTMVPGPRARRSHWTEGLEVKDLSSGGTAPVVYYAGCRTCYDRGMWSVARSTVRVLRKAGVDVAVAGSVESCCGGRSYVMGYAGELEKQARSNEELFRTSGAETIITGCAECYHAFKVLYPKIGVNLKPEVLHSVGYFDRLIKEGRLKPTKNIEARVTYQDPCRLGRLGEPYVHWAGQRVAGQMYRFDPPKPYRRGTNGVYEPPRRVLRSIPGLRIVEMDRTREYAWCCGAGGGVKENNPEFAEWTALERIGEAESTGAEILVTACPGCERNFKDAAGKADSSITICDVVELLEKAV